MVNNLFNVANSLLYPKGQIRMGLFTLILLLMCICGLLVYYTGGTNFSYLHTMYLPIIMAGMLFSWPGGIIAGILGGVILGPLMPADVSQNLAQAHQVWLYRSFFFLAIGIFSGVSSSILRSYLQVLEKRYLTDPITELPNLRGLQKSYTLLCNSDEGIKPAVITLRMRQIREIDKAMGPEASEQLYQTIAERLLETINEQAIVARMDTGCFVILVKKYKQAALILEFMKQSLGNVFNINDIPVFVEIFYGLVEGEQNESLPSLVRKADIAADMSEQNSRIQTKFHKNDDVDAKRSVQIIHDFNHSISQDILKLFYQPKINLQTGEVIGVEALVRWPHPELGMVPPQEFIPLTEHTLLINPYTKWLLQQSVHQLSLWRDMDINLKMAVNFSMKNFQDPTVLDELFSLIDDYDIEPRTFEIEVTESAVAANIKDVADLLRTLRERKVNIAVDDFGTGQSSLHYLFELPLDVIKIDQVFTRSMLTNSAAEAIIRSTVFLANELNLQIVVEGVETEEEYLKLKSIGCEIGQGYYWAKPMPAELMTEWLQTQKLPPMSA